MKLFLLLILALPGSLITATNAAAQTNFVASISPKQIFKNEYATLRMVVENGNTIQKIDAPPLKDFTVISGPNPETGMNTVNGKVYQYAAISYIVQPRRSGRLVLGTAAAIVDGKTYKSKRLSIVVKSGTGSTPNNNPPSGPFTIIDPFEDQQPAEKAFDDNILKKGDNLQEKIQHNMQLRLETSKNSVYIGQPLVASYNLYTRLKSDSRLAKNPSFNGFSVIDLQRPDAFDFSSKKLNGREYNVYTIRKVQLYPLQAGQFELESATLDNEVQLQKEGAAQGFGSIGINPDNTLIQKMSLSSKPVTIMVKPLPEKGQPASFDGAVGNFDMNVSVQKNNFSTDESGLLRITIAGEGNMQLVTAPRVQWPAGIDVFDTKLADDLVTTNVPVSGNKIFDIPFAINKEGEYEIPPVEFSFFNPVSATYQSVSSRPILLHISKGTGNNKVFQNFPAEKKENLSPLNQLFRNRPLVVTLIASLIIGGLIFWLRKEQKKEEIQQQEQLMEAEKQQEEAAALAAAIPQNPLEQSEECLYRQNCLDFYILLNREIKEFFAKKFSLPAGDISVKKITLAMDQAGMKNEYILNAEKLLHDIEWQLYTPSLSSDERNSMYSRAQQMVQMINTDPALKSFTL